MNNFFEGLFDGKVISGRKTIETKIEPVASSVLRPQKLHYNKIITTMIIIIIIIIIIMIMIMIMIMITNNDN